MGATCRGLRLKARLETSVGGRRAASLALPSLRQSRLGCITPSVMPMVGANSLFTQLHERLSSEGKFETAVLLAEYMQLPLFFVLIVGAYISCKLRYFVISYLQLLKVHPLS
jgi:hypothetical protein